MIIVALLGWVGFQASEQQIAGVVDLAIEGAEKSSPAPQTDQQKSPAPADAKKPKQVKEPFNQASFITDERRIHILYGDATGGGHLYGQNKPCKSEFPQHWNEDTIIKEVELIAANDNLNWHQQRNGYYVTQQKVGTVTVRVVKDRDNKNVITAYPTNTYRNPCPANDG
jgi:hypothetical protein